MRLRWTLGRGRRRRIGRGFLGNWRMRLRGPGRVVIGDGVNAWANSGRNILSTHDPHAELIIGNRVRLNGAGIQCATRIEIGDDCILATCTIVDTDHHGIDPQTRHLRRGVQTAPVVLEPNVWIVGGTMILKGVRIGRGSVVGFGSVVTSDIPPGVVAAGRPARVVRVFEGSPHPPVPQWRLAVESGPLKDLEHACEQVAGALKGRTDEASGVKVRHDGQAMRVTLAIPAPARGDAMRYAVMLVEEAATDAAITDFAVRSVELV